jgi:hypothetical protein
MDAIDQVVGTPAFVQGPTFPDCHDGTSEGHHPAYKFSRWYFGPKVVVDMMTNVQAVDRAEEIKIKQVWADGKDMRYAVVVEGDLTELRDIMAEDQTPKTRRKREPA